MINTSPSSARIFVLTVPVVFLPFIFRVSCQNQKKYLPVNQAKCDVRRNRDDMFEVNT